MNSCLRNSTTCSSGDLRALGMNLQETCEYFNATQYQPYRECTKLLYSFVTFNDGR